MAQGTVADNRNLISFTWAICRLFNPVILMVGVLLMGGGKRRYADFRLILIVNLTLGFVAYEIIYFCATSRTLPETMFPDSLITRPFDVVPLALFIIAGIFVFPRISFLP